MDDYARIFDNKDVIMIVTAHPDDLDAMCGGTVARLTSDGKTVVSIKTTTGNNGSRDKVLSPAFLAKKRQAEDEKAMKKLGIKPEHSVSLGFDDGSIENTKEVIEQISYYIRKFQPQVVITLNPESTIVNGQGGKSWVNHRDHRNTARATVDAVYPFSRDRSFFANQFHDTSIKPSRCNELLLADFCPGENAAKINITDFTDQKLAALECHASQFSKESAKQVAKMYNITQENKSFEAFQHINLA